MTIPTPGFRIFREIRRPDPALVARFADLAAADVGDVMATFNVMEAAIGRIAGDRMVGPAVTVTVRAGDNLLIHKAIDTARAGDVLVVDGRADLVNALIGENLALWAQKQGIVGIVVDGAVRDVEALRAIGLPIFARGITPAGTFKSGGGEVNVPISCGRVVVAPGDVVVADADGVTVVPAADAEAVLAGIAAKHEVERRAKLGIAAGDWVRPACTDDAVAAAGGTFIDAAR
jgi:RraA family protein